MTKYAKLIALQRAVEHARVARRIYNGLEYGNGYSEATDDLMAQVVLALTVAIELLDLEQEAGA